MRLIDADLLKKNIAKWLQVGDPQETEMVELDDIAVSVVMEIEEQPTVYDWIPCEKKLPTVTKDYLVTKMCENDDNPIYETAHEIFYIGDKKWDCERDEYCEWKVIAWQDKMKPYIPESK